MSLRKSVLIISFLFFSCHVRQHLSFVPLIFNCVVVFSFSHLLQLLFSPTVFVFLFHSFTIRLHLLLSFFLSCFVLNFFSLFVSLVHIHYSTASSSFFLSFFHSFFLACFVLNFFLSSCFTRSYSQLDRIFFFLSVFPSFFLSLAWF